MTREAAARSLASALQAGNLTAPLDDALLGDAYALQQDAIAAAGGKVAGWKIGATNAKAQALLQCDGPFYGPVMPSCDATGKSSAPVSPGHGGAEIELAFRLGADLPRRDAPYSRDELRAAIASMHPAIEVIGVRQKLDGPLTAARAIPDFGGNVLFAAGDANSGWQELQPADIAARCLVNGEEKAAGTADIVLGDPLSALAWLADNGPGLHAGEWISTGTITGVTPVRAGDEVRGDFGPLGSISLRLEG